MTKILIADSYNVITRGLKLYFEKLGNLDVDEVSTVDELLHKLDKWKYDVIVTEININGNDIFETMYHINKTWPNIPVIIFSMFPEKHYAIRLIKAGAYAYVSKSKGLSELNIAMRKALRGESYMTPILKELMYRSIIDNCSKSPHELLSVKEFQVFRLMAQGHKLNEISQIMHITKRTISNHRAQVLKKLNLKNNSDISSYALRNKMVKIE